MTDMELNMSNLELGRGGAIEEYIEPARPLEGGTMEEFNRRIEELKRFFQNERDRMTLPSAV